MRDLPVPPTNNVQMVDYAFGQNNIIVPVGTMVTWRKTGATTHTATALEESWVHAGATTTCRR